MFNDYYMFNKEVDEKLKELGFELNNNELRYEKICQEDSLIVKYEITNDYVSAQRFNVVPGCCSYRFVNYLENKTLDEIVNMAKKSLDDLSNNYSKVIEFTKIYELEEMIRETKNLRRIELNDSVMNYLTNVHIVDVNDGKREFGYVSSYDTIPVYLNNDLNNNEIKISY